MAQRTTTAEKPAPKRHVGRMGCLVIIGVILLVVVSTVFAPDFPRQANSPSASPLPGSTAFASATLSVASTPEVMLSPSVTLTAEPSRPELSETSTVTHPFDTPEGKPPTQIAISSPTHTATAFPTPTRTPSPTSTPTVALILATNTHPALILVTNTPSTSGE